MPRSRESARQPVAADPAQRTTRLLGVAIAGGFSSEVRVMSTMLANAPGIDAALAIHAWDEDRDSVIRVRELSGADVRGLDLGWRPPRSRSKAVRARQFAASLFRLLGTSPKLIRFARSHRPDVVYSSQQKWDCAVAAVVAAIIRRPHVIHLHYIPGPWLGRFTTRRLHGGGTVIAVSDFIRERAIAAGTDPTCVVAVLNPVSVFPQAARSERQRVRAGLGIDDSHIAIGFVGRISPWKGQTEAIQALARLGDQASTARLLLVGDGEIVDELRALATSLGVADRVQFTGVRSDVPELLASFDVFVHPSYEDPCPLAVLEAQAAGLPTVAFDEGGVREIVADGVTGLLAPDRNVDELAHRLAQLISDPELRSTMGAAAEKRATTTFSPSRAGAAFARVVAGVPRR